MSWPQYVPGPSKTREALRASVEKMEGTKTRNETHKEKRRQRERERERERETKMDTKEDKTKSAARKEKEF